MGSEKDAGKFIEGVELRVFNQPELLLYYLVRVCDP
jgi:hypothetical protein